jgi:hypothetical protein
MPLSARRPLLQALLLGALSPEVQAALPEPEAEVSFSGS